MKDIKEQHQNALYTQNLSKREGRRTEKKGNERESEEKQGDRERIF
jgi:hypothetical protein